MKKSVKEIQALSNIETIELLKSVTGKRKEIMIDLISAIWFKYFKAHNTLVSVNGTELKCIDLMDNINQLIEKISSFDLYYIEVNKGSKMKNVNSTENQRIKSEFVTRHVSQLCNELIEFLQKNHEHDYIDEVMSVSSKPDYESAVDYNLPQLEKLELIELAEEFDIDMEYYIDFEQVNETLEAIHGYVFGDKDNDLVEYNELTDYEYKAYNIDFIIDTLMKHESFGYEEMCNRFNWDYDYNEALQFFVVSGYLAHQLEERGEMVEEIMGFSIWGRCTFGQAISLDGVISEICYKDLV